jgi:hypothetical protein
MTIKATFTTKIYNKETYENVVKFEVEDDKYYFTDKAGWRYELLKSEVTYLLITD